MKNYRLICFCTGFLVAACAATALARTWIDSTGKHKTDGEFVKLTAGEVEIRRSDGTLIRVPLERLSENDQQYVRQAAKPVVGETPFAVTEDETKPAVKPRNGGGVKEVQTVFAEGVGTTREEALKDAFRAAVRQVVGEVVDGETLVKNEDLVKDEVLTYSDGFIPKHKVTSEKHANGLFRVSILASVQRRSVIMKLKAAHITLKALDGQSLYGSLVTELDAEKDAAALVAKVLEGFPDNCLEARVVGQPKTLTKSGSDATLVINIQLAPSKAAYEAFAARMCHALDKSCKAKGEFTSVIRRTREAPSSPSAGHTMEDEFSVILDGANREGFRLSDSPHDYGVNAQFSKWMPELWKNHGWDARWVSKDFTIAVATLISKDSSRINWNYYLFDESVGKVVLRAASRQVECKLSFLDAEDQLVAVDRFDPQNDVLDHRHFNLCRDLLVCLWGGTSNVPDGFWLQGREAYMKSEGFRPKLGFVAPLLFGWAWRNDRRDFHYVPTLTIPRKITLSLDEWKMISKIKCELTFRETIDKPKQ